MRVVELVRLPHSVFLVLCIAVRAEHRINIIIPPLHPIPRCIAVELNNIKMKMRCCAVEENAKTGMSWENYHHPPAAK